ncbi:DUF2922 domain-containing protein [Romboutsia sp.]|uniref:DUF2922 domain-containing protein n=1 Tax=Romboutsia sp. TaxID=1965302 RepID=UPI003F2C4C52
MDVKKRLVMTFKTISDKKVSLSIDDPRDNLSEAEIKTAMTMILSKDVFAPNGEPLAALLEANVVQTETTPYDLVL